MSMAILQRFTNAVLCRDDGDNIRLALETAVLKRTTLTEAMLRGADLRGAMLTGAMLTGAMLTGAMLTEADLRGADLTGAMLTGADLRGAMLTEADIPVVPALDHAILAALEAGGTLDMRTWHTCGTTHCRAGWAIVLAGDAGVQLEARVGAGTAGALIYAASTGYIPNFYATHADALADLRAHAAQTGA
jgi:hypothetical protein